MSSKGEWQGQGRLQDMGSLSAMSSINRVLEKHGAELEAELRSCYKSKLIRRFSLGSNIYSIDVEAELTDGTMLALEPYDIDVLAERFPDCEVGY